jgi:hypothetical protein
MSTGFLDFSDITITEGGGVPLPTGVFPGRVQTAQIVASSKGTPQVEFKVEITEFDYAGAVRTEWINLSPSDPTDAKKVASHKQVWATAFLAVGLTPDELRAAGPIAHQQIPGIFAGRDCVVEISERTKMDGTTTQRLRFLKPATYATRRAAQDAAGGPQGAPAVAPAAPAAPTPLAVAAPSALPTPPAAPAAAPSNGIAAPAAAPASAGLAALLNR